MISINQVKLLEKQVYSNESARITKQMVISINQLNVLEKQGDINKSTKITRRQRNILLRS
jgi:hypothetical protein